MYIGSFIYKYLDNGASTDINNTMINYYQIILLTTSIKLK